MLWYDLLELLLKNKFKVNLKVDSDRMSLNREIPKLELYEYLELDEDNNQIDNYTRTGTELFINNNRYGKIYKVYPTTTIDNSLLRSSSEDISNNNNNNNSNAEDDRVNLDKLDILKIAEDELNKYKKCKIVIWSGTEEVNKKLKTRYRNRIKIKAVKKAAK